jgi:hypothetical protein
VSQPYDVPLFGSPDPVRAERIQSAKDADDAANKVYWRRYKIAGIVCWEWINAPQALRQSQCGPATWLRIQGPDQRALCYRHRQDYLDREALDRREQ